MEVTNHVDIINYPCINSVYKDNRHTFNYVAYDPNCYSDIRVEKCSTCNSLRLIEDGKTIFLRYETGVPKTTAKEDTTWWPKWPNF